MADPVVPEKSVGTLAAAPAQASAAQMAPIRQSPSRIKRVITTDLELEQEEMKQSRKAIREALRVLEYHDSTFQDQFTAARILTFVTLEHHRSSRLAWWISIFLFLCILLNTISFVVGTVKTTWVRPTSCASPVCVPGDGSPCTTVVCEPEENPILWHIEMWTIIIFTVDYLLRVLTAHAVPADLVFHRSLEYTMDGRLKDRSTRRTGGCGKTTKYMMSPLNIIDLLSILPYYILVAIKHTKAAKHADILRMFRFLRFLLIFKLGRRFRLGGIIIGRTLRASLPALIIFLFLTVCMGVTFGSIMYYFEGGLFQVTPEFPAGGFLRPNARNTAMEMSPFVSIFTGIYWFVVNTTTLGNCALFPTTTGGRIFSCVVAYVGLASLALPISIIGKNFSEQYDLVYHTHPDAAKTFGQQTPKGHPDSAKNGKRPLRTPRAMTPSMKALSQMVGPDGSGKGGAFFNKGGPAAEDEIEALRMHFQSQIDALRSQLEAAASNPTHPSSSWEAAAPMHEELESLRAYVEKEINSLKHSLARGQPAMTPPLSDDDMTMSGGLGLGEAMPRQASAVLPRGLSAREGSAVAARGASGVPTAATVGEASGPVFTITGPYSAAVTAALAQAAQNDEDDEDDDEYVGAEERRYQQQREMMRQHELQRFRSQMQERRRGFWPQQELATMGGGGLM